MKVWLDDCREAPDNSWFIARSIEPIKGLLKNKWVTDLSLDNDLGLCEAPGRDLVDWMIENNNWPTNSCTVHSGNIIAAERMRQDIKKYFKPGDKNGT